MKVLDTPRTGRLGAQVAYLSPFGTCFRTLTIPHDPRTEAQLRARRAFAAASRGWGLELTDPQRERWCAAAQTVPSWPTLRQYSHLSGQQFCVKINNTLQAVGQPPVAEPPSPVAFSPNVVGELTVDYDENGAVRLRLAVGTAVEDIMLYGQAPCSAGRMKHRRVCYLGLLGPATGGQCDITAPYIARFGKPRPGQKIFVVTCQHKNGWKGPDHVTNAIVPPQPPPGSPKSPFHTTLFRYDLTQQLNRQQSPALFDLLDGFGAWTFIVILIFFVASGASEQTLLPPVIDQVGLAVDQFANLLRSEKPAGTQARVAAR